MPYYVPKIHTWKDNWNDIVRYVIFQDEQFLKLLCVKDNVSITEFIEKYFIQIKSGSELLTNEKVRILYYDDEGSDTRNKNVRGKTKQFDIYVRDDVLHSGSRDKLVNLYDLITERLKYLILNNCEKYGLRFKFYDSYNLWTKTQGYRRYHVVFSYNITV